MKHSRTNYPHISIVIATFNSEKTLPLTLDSIKKQTYPKEKIEILVIDGGSKDNTVSIAKNYHCTIIPNPRTDLIYAKQIGFTHAKGKYLVYLDSDEVYENPASLMLKYSAFQKNKNIASVMLGGYKTPSDSSPINNYINEFGDPFSFFMYRESKGDQFFYGDWSKKYKDITLSDDNECIILDFSKIKTLPLIELWAGGSMIDLSYTKKYFSFIQKQPEFIAHLFYLFNKEKKYLAITKADYTIHYSCPTLQKYFNKLRSRIKNNMFHTEMGRGGFEGRANFEPLWFRIKKYVFIPYSFSILFPLIDCIYLTITRKKTIYLLHSILCIYTSSLIVYYICMKLFHQMPAMKTYGH